MREDVGLKQGGGSSTNGGNWRDSQYILEVKPAVLPDGFDVESKEKRVIKGDY